MRYLKLIVTYDGTNYHGFQTQKNAVGIQQIIEKGLSKLFGETIVVAASGRTDTGVHAKGQVISFRTKGTVPVERIVPAMVSYLPSDIVVIKAEETDKDFNARYCAIGKRYIYRILVTDNNSPFFRNLTWQMKNAPQIELLQAAADVVIGQHDFAAFRSAGSSAKTTIRTIYRAKWTQSNNEYQFSIEGNGFLYKMVRNLVGAMVRVGLGIITLEEFRVILEAKDRSLAGKSAPAHGLYLDEVFYEEK